MTDHIPNDLSHLSNAEFNALCPQGEHAPGPAMTDITSAYTPPQLGDRRVSVEPWLEAGKWIVDVKVFKANTLRGDAYWETEVHKSYAKKADAERFAARFN